MIGAMSKEFVLVHGMSHGAWAWDLLARRLERDGHRVVAPDLPGHGRRAHERRRASLATYVRAVADATIQAGFSRATVVGHSMGGVVLPGVAGLIPARLGVTPIDLDCAHNPMLSAVDELAKILTKLP